MKTQSDLNAIRGRILLHWSRADYPARDDRVTQTARFTVTLLR
jgi:hypothetical protein